MSIGGANSALTNATIHYNSNGNSVGIKEISDPLSSIDYLAFSNLSYSNWSVGDTIYGKMSNKWNESVTGSAACDGLTNRKLYENIANWKVITTSRSWGAAKSSGFYAVTFQGETTEGIQTVIWSMEKSALFSLIMMVCMLRFQMQTPVPWSPTPTTIPMPQMSTQSTP